MSTYWKSIKLGIWVIFIALLTLNVIEQPSIHKKLVHLFKIHPINHQKMNISVGIYPANFVKQL